MKLYLANIRGLETRHERLAPKERIERAERYRFSDDRKRCIAGGILLKKFLGSAQISKNEFGKPISSDGRKFNLSHSGDWVLLALDSVEIGCDIEKIKFVKYEKTGKFVFSENEMRLLKNTPDKAGAFFEMWTKKEALLKCMGKGFHREAKSVDVSKECFDDNGEKYYMKTYKFSDYFISVCSVKNEFAKGFEFVDFKKL